MSNNELLVKIKDLKELKVMADELADQIAAIEGEIKGELTLQGVDRLAVGPYKISWTRYITRRLDSKALKAELPDVYSRFAVESEARRFCVA